MESKINDKNELIYEANSLIDTEKSLVVAKEEERWGKDGLGGWGELMQTITYRVDKNTVLLIAQATIFNVLR